MVKIPVGSRKIQKSTNRSYFLNLPLWWINQLGLSKGDKIDIYRSKSGSLLLKPNLDFHASLPISKEEQPTEDEGSIQLAKRLEEITGSKIIGL